MNFGEGESQTLEFSPAFPATERSSFGQTNMVRVETNTAIESEQSGLCSQLFVDGARIRSNPSRTSRELGAVPYVRHLKRRNQLKRLRPVRSGVFAYRGLVVAYSLGVSCSCSRPDHSRSDQPDHAIRRQARSLMVDR